MALSFDEELPAELPDALPVYGLPPADISLGAIAREARRHQMSGEVPEVRRVGDWAVHEEGRRAVAVHARSGAVRYHHRDRYGVLQREQPFEVPDDAAEEIARRFVTEAEFAPGEGIEVERVTHLRTAGAASEDEERREDIIDAGVLFRRVVDGLRVEGPGGFLMVNVDTEREVVATNRVWRQRGRRVAEVAIRPREHALWALERLAERVRGDVRVLRSRLGYFELGELDEQAHLQPAYAFVYQVEDGEIVYKGAEVVPAGERTFGQLIGPKRFPVRPRPRER